MGSCCGITTRSKATVCLECRAEGKPVGLKTLQHLVIEEKRGACACEINNPSGRCCLGDVGKVEKRLLQERRNAA